MKNIWRFVFAAFLLVSCTKIVTLPIDAEKWMLNVNDSDKWFFANMNNDTCVFTISYAERSVPEGVPISGRPIFRKQEEYSLSGVSSCFLDYADSFGLSLFADSERKEGYKVLLNMVDLWSSDKETKEIGLRETVRINRKKDHDDDHLIDSFVWDFEIGLSEFKESNGVVWRRVLLPSTSK